ncbi:MAG: hypothetical protein WC456_03230 [Patescibacteria group bacterium]
MTGEEIKRQIILTILKFYQITDNEHLFIQRSEFSGLSDAEINTTILTLEKNKLIEVIDNRAVRNDMDAMMYKALRRFDYMIEIRILDGFMKHVSDQNLSSYLEEKEKTAILKITYDNHKLKINEIIIAKPHFESENDYFATYITNNPGKKLTNQEFVKFKNSKMTKKFDQIINDLGFKGNIKKLFFPNISIKAVEFRNQITMEDMKKAGIDDIYPSDFPSKK